MKNGTIVEQGSHADLLAAGGEYASLYNMQAKAFAPLSPSSLPIIDNEEEEDRCTEPDHLSHVSSSLGDSVSSGGGGGGSDELKGRQRDRWSVDGSSWGKQSVGPGDPDLIPTC